MVAAGLAAAAALALTPAGGFAGPSAHGAPARFRVGAATVSISPPVAGQAPGGDPANCAHSPLDLGARPFAFAEPYVDLKHDGHFDPGDPYVDCNGNGRWDGNLLGGGGNTPRFYDQVADPVSARAMVVSNGRRTIAVEVLDQEGLFNVYQQRIRARVARRRLSPRRDLHLRHPRRVGARQPRAWAASTQTTSGVNDYWVNFMVDRSRARDRAGRPGAAAGHDPLHRGARAGEPAPVLVLVPVRR